MTDETIRALAEEYSSQLRRNLALGAVHSDRYVVPWETFEAHLERFAQAVLARRSGYDQGSLTPITEHVTALRDTVRELEQQLDAAQARLVKYGRHLPWCAMRSGYDGPCTCGLEEGRKE